MWKKLFNNKNSPNRYVGTAGGNQWDVGQSQDQ